MNNSTTELQKLPADSSAPVAENRMLPAVCAILAVLTHLIWMTGLFLLITSVDISDAAAIGFFLIIGYGIILFYYGLYKYKR